MKLKHFDQLAFRHLVGAVEKSVAKRIDQELAVLAKRGLLDRVRKQGNNVKMALRNKPVEAELPGGLWIGGDIVVIEESVDEESSYVSVVFAPLPEGTIRETFTHLSWIRRHQSGRIESYQIPLFMTLLPDSKKYYVRGTYQVYRHSFSNKGRATSGKNDLEQIRKSLDMSTYIGITKQGWQKRYRQHINEAKAGSHCLFHEALRDTKGFDLVEHEVYAAGLSYDDAMDVEEYWVENLSLFPKGLNMIPGGHAGLRYLGRMNALRRGDTGEDRDRAISDAMSGQSGKNDLSNSLIAERWTNPLYATAVICNRDDRLSPDQIRMARILAGCDWDVASITEHVQARNENQIKRLLAGTTYSRIV